MPLEFCSLASSSSGNCYLVKSERTALLVDVGIAGKRIIEGLESKGVRPEALDGILITHEHIDHVRSVRMMGQKAVSAKIYASKGTMDCIGDKVPTDRGRVLEGDYDSFYVGDIKVQPFHLSHDATEPVGYSFFSGERKLVIVTDTGCVTDEIYGHVEGADLLVLESNHEVNILTFGPYPFKTKRRILSDVGHLSNESAGECLCHMLKGLNRKKVPTVALAHLSKENNTPEQAYLTIRNILEEEDFYINKDLDLFVIGRDSATALIEV